MCLVVSSKGSKLESAPNVYLKCKVLDFVDSFKYLGHWINSKFTKDKDIKHKIRSLSVRGNILLRKFGVCTGMLCYLFKTF